MNIKKHISDYYNNTQFNDILEDFARKLIKDRSKIYTLHPPCVNNDSLPTITMGDKESVGYYIEYNIMNRTVFSFVCDDGDQYMQFIRCIEKPDYIIDKHFA